MADENIQKSLHDRFLELPSRIKEWLTSERATFIVIEINKRLELVGEDLKIIPRLIARLVIKDLAPENFISELSKQLRIEGNAAETITQDIFQRILRPIDMFLKEINVFPELIFGKGQKIPPQPLRIVPPIPPSVSPIPRPAPSIPLTSPRPTPPTPPTAPSTIPIVRVPINIMESKSPLPPIPPKEEKS